MRVDHARKRKSSWTLLYRKEKGMMVVIYEPLKQYQIQRKFKQGWKKVY